MRVTAVTVAFIFLVVANAAGFGLTLEFAENARDDVVSAQRDTCETIGNTVLANQYGGIKDQVEQTDESLKGDLGSLEDFRKEIKAANDARKARIRKLERAVSMLSAQQKRPWLVDCERAYPE